MIEWKKSSRGFAFGEFHDMDGNRCSIQESSLATDDCIWLGIDDAKPMIMASDAPKLGITTDKVTGWIPYPIPEEVLLRTRMHLNREQALRLIEALRVFMDTGRLIELVIYDEVESFLKTKVQK
jgi:hypothetical protein